MKSSATYLIFLIGVAIAPRPSHAIEVSRTVPVGIVKLGDTTVGEPSIQANTDVHISIPFLKPATGTAEVSSISGTTVTLQNISAPIPSITSSLPRYYLMIETGANAGLVALVNASTSTTITVTLQPDDSLAGTVSGDGLSLRPAWTVGSFIGFSHVTGTQLLGYTGLATVGLNPAPDIIYEFNGTDWEDTNSSLIASNDAIFPNESFILRTLPGHPIAMLTVSGEVSTVPSRVHILNFATTGKDNTFSYFGSYNEPILGCGLSSIAGAGDSVFYFDNGFSGINKASNGSFEYDGFDWYDTNSGDPIDSSAVLEAGKGYLYRRLYSSGMTTVLWSDLPDYLPLASP